MQYDLPVDGPQDTFSEARPLTAFPEAEAVAPAGTCAAVAAVEKRTWKQQYQMHWHICQHFAPNDMSNSKVTGQHIRVHNLN